MGPVAEIWPDEPEGWRHVQIPGDGVTLHGVAAGEGPLILFLHGFPEYWYAWRRQLAEFSSTHCAVALDLRGYNLSDKPEAVEAYALSHLIADVKAVLDRLSGGRKAVLVGHDWGGVLAWLLAAHHPEYLERLVIINAPHPTLFARELAQNPMQQAASSYMLLFRSAAAETTLSAFNFAALRKAVFDLARAGAFTEEDRLRYLEAWRQPGALTGGLNYYRAAKIGPSQPAAEQELPSALPRITVPTLVLWGERDTALLSENLEGLGEVVESVKVVRLPEGTHWVVHEEPERINREIREFLAQV